MEKKTKYLLSLETLSSLVKESSSTDDLSARLDMLSRLLHAHTVLCLFQSADAEAKEKISFQKFYDVDFSYWSNSKNWKINEVLSFDDEEMTERYLLQNWTSATPVLSSSDFNNIAGTLPTPPASIDFDDANGRDSMRQILSNLSGPYFSSGYLRYALFSIIQQICDTLRSLQRSLRTQRSEADYRQFHDDLWLRYRTAHIQELLDEYENIKAHRLGEITTDWLQEKLQDELLRLYNSPFFTCLMEAVTFTRSNETPILYDLNGVEKRMTKKFYYVLTQLEAVQDDRIDFSACGIALGRFICNFQDQLSPLSHESFFRFRIMSSLIQKEMAACPAPSMSPSQTIERAAKFCTYIVTTAARSRDEIEADLALFSQRKASVFAKTLRRLYKHGELDFGEDDVTTIFSYLKDRYQISYTYPNFSAVFSLPIK